MEGDANPEVGVLAPGVLWPELEKFPAGNVGDRGSGDGLGGCACCGLIC